MTTKPLYPFYRSLRFRFGLLFNCLLLVFLLAIIFLLFGNVKHELENNFRLRLSNGAAAVLQKTEVNPTTIPLPQNGEHFALTYNSGKRTDTLFTNLTAGTLPNANDSLYKSLDEWRFSTHKTLETGGIINVIYALPSYDYNASLKQLQTLLLFYIPIAIVVSFVAGYFLSGILLQPLYNIIAKANRIDLTHHIKLLDEPSVKDELHQLVDALNRMLSRIEKQSQQQNAFFASASHELRTPLSNMLTELQTMDVTSAPPTMQTLIENQVAEVQRLKKLVNTFLLMSQLKAGALPSSKSSFSLGDLCLDIINEFQAGAKEKGQLFKVELLPSYASFRIVADEEHMFIIIKNLVENAVKYGLPYRTIALRLQESKGSISILVQNETGVAIEDVGALKQEFNRSENLQEGFGLGLWIADELANRNGFVLTLTYDDKVFSAQLVCPFGKG